MAPWCIHISCLERVARAGSGRDSVRGLVGAIDAELSRPDWLATVQSGRKQVQSRVCTPSFRRGQSRRRIRFKTRSMENGLYTSEITNMLTFGGFTANAIVVNVGCMHRAIDLLIFEKTTCFNRHIGNGLPKILMLQ